MEIDKLVKGSLNSKVANVDLTEDRYDNMLNYIEKQCEARRNRVLFRPFHAIAQLTRNMHIKDFIEVAAIVIFLAAIPVSIKYYNSNQNLQHPGKSGNPVSTVGPTSTPDDVIDYNQYSKRTWCIKNFVNESGHENFSFYITKIENGEITGFFSIRWIFVANSYVYLPESESEHLSGMGNLTGTINKDTAECQFSDKDGNKGTIKLLFKAKNEIEATIKFTDKSPIYKDIAFDGTFQFIPYNISNVEGFSPFEDQSFMVNLNSWGDVKFVTGKLTGGNHIPTVFYLTDQEGNLLYDFADTPFPYSVDVKAVSFTDVNRDGLKDIIVIVADAYNGSADFGKPIAAVWLQNTNGKFICDTKLYQEINESGNNKDIKTVTEYLSRKF